MKTENLTSWSTRDLRRFLWRTLKEFGMEPQEYSVLIRYRRGKVMGRGRYFGKWLSVHMGRDWSPTPSGKLSVIHKITMVHIIRHEVSHNAGVRHRDIDGGRYIKQVSYEEDLVAFPWVKEIDINIKKQKPKPTAEDRAAKREAHVRKMVERWERKLKLAKTKLAQWKRKAKCYGRKRADGQE